MKGDFTRDTFDRTKHYSRVLMQQGRVQLDADWNEQTAILLHYLRTLATDVFGPHAGPADGSGFEIIMKGTPDADEKIEALEAEDTRKKELKNAINQDNDGVILPGRYYVEGVLVEIESAILYSDQSGYPFDPETTVQSLKELGRGFLIYLDVWERHITYVEDDHMREVALDGPDTCTRAQVVWQVKVLLEPEETQDFKCDSLKTMLAREFPRLRARARLDKPPSELCVISPESRYRGAENQLYRVEVHGEAAEDGTVATYKWSRENGSVTFPIRTLSATTATLEHLGRDKPLSLKPGDWVEIVDEAIATSGRAGPLAQVQTVNRDELTVTLTYADVTPSPVPSYAEADTVSKRPLLRRWDHAGDLKTFGGALPIEEQNDLAKGGIDLEDDVRIWFAEGGQYRSGDYWLIPARVATGDVEWPDELNPGGNPIPAFLGPHGPRHYYAPLFLSSPDNPPDQRTSDCRCRIEPLKCFE